MVTKAELLKQTLTGRLQRRQVQAIQQEEVARQQQQAQQIVQQQLQQQQADQSFVKEVNDAVNWGVKRLLQGQGVGSLENWHNRQAGLKALEIIKEWEKRPETQYLYRKGEDIRGGGVGYYGVQQLQQEGYSPEAIREIQKGYKVETTELPSKKVSEVTIQVKQPSFFGTIPRIGTYDITTGTYTSPEGQKSSMRIKDVPSKTQIVISPKKPSYIPSISSIVTEYKPTIPKVDLTPYEKTKLEIIRFKKDRPTYISKKLGVGAEAIFGVFSAPQAIIAARETKKQEPLVALGEWKVKEDFPQKKTVEVTDITFPTEEELVKKYPFGAGKELFFRKQAEVDIKSQSVIDKEIKELLPEYEKEIISYSKDLQSKYQKLIDENKLTQTQAQKKLNSELENYTKTKQKEFEKEVMKESKEELEVITKDAKDYLKEKTKSIQIQQALSLVPIGAAMGAGISILGAIPVIGAITSGALIGATVIKAPEIVGGFGKAPLASSIQVGSYALGGALGIEGLKALRGQATITGKTIRYSKEKMNQAFDKSFKDFVKFESNLLKDKRASFAEASQILKKKLKKKELTALDEIELMLENAKLEGEAAKVRELLKKTSEQVKKKIEQLPKEKQGEIIKEYQNWLLRLHNKKIIDLRPKYDIVPLTQADKIAKPITFFKEKVIPPQQQLIKPQQVLEKQKIVTLQTQAQPQLQRQKQKLLLKQRQAQITLQALAQPQAFAQLSAQATLQAQRQVQRQVQPQLYKTSLISQLRTLRPRPRRPLPKPRQPLLIIPKRYPSGLLKKLAKEVSKKEEPFEVFGRRFGRDIKLFEALTKPEAKAKLKGWLKGGLGASGFITKDTRKIKVDLGFEFRPAKREPLRIVQKRGFRLATFPEVKEIQLFRKRKRRI